MRSLLSHTVRPRIGQVGTTSPQVIGRSTRKTVRATSRQKLSFNDAFTILLAPVLGTALIADTTWKDRQQVDWDAKLSGVEAEIAAIRGREIQIWSRLQLRSVRHGAVVQRRAFASQAHAFAYDPDELDEEMPDFGDELIPAWVDQQPKLSDAELAKWQHYETLVASKLAIEMILHMRSGKSVLHRLPSEIALDSSIYPESLDQLIRQLVTINANLKTLAAADGFRAVPMSLLRTPEREELHARIAALSRSCRRGQLPVRDLVHGYAQAITEAKIAPSAATYGAMLEALAVQDDDSLVYTVMAAIKTSKQHLSDRALWLMLWSYGKYRDSGRLDDFLWLLTKEDSMFILKGKWQLVFVNGVRVAIPPDRNPELIAILVRAALQCGMMHKAEAWATIMFQQGQRCKKFAKVFLSMVQYCAENGDWKTGRDWMKKTIQWASVLSTEAPEMLSNLFFRMLELCVACDQPAEYDKIMRAASLSRIELNEVSPERPEYFSDRALNIRGHWERLQVQRPILPVVDEHSSLAERVRQFQKSFVVDDPTLKPFVGVTVATDLMALSESKPTSGSDDVSRHTILSPDSILAGLASEGTSVMHKNNRELRKSLKKLLKHIDEQKNEIKRLAEECKTKREEIVLLKKGPISQATGPTLPELKVQQVSGQDGDSRPRSHLLHLHLTTDQQKQSQDLPTIQQSTKPIGEDNEQPHVQIGWTPMIHRTNEGVTAQNSTSNTPAAQEEDTSHALSPTKKIVEQKRNSHTNPSRLVSKPKSTKERTTTTAPAMSFSQPPTNTYHMSQSSSSSMSDNAASAAANEQMRTPPNRLALHM